MKFWEYIVSLVCPTYGTIKNMQRGAQITEKAGEEIVQDLTSWIKPVVIAGSLIVVVIIIILIVRARK